MTNPIPNYTQPLKSTLNSIVDFVPGKWYRVIERTPDRIVLNSLGIETPGAECAYVHSTPYDITKKQASKHSIVNAEYEALQIHNKEAATAENKKRPRELRRHKMTLFGYDVYTEDGQSILCWYDSESSLNYNMNHSGWHHCVLIPLV